MHSALIILRGNILIERVEVRERDARNVAGIPERPTSYAKYNACPHLPSKMAHFLAFLHHGSGTTVVLLW